MEYGDQKLTLSVTNDKFGVAWWPVLIAGAVATYRASMTTIARITGRLFLHDFAAIIGAMFSSYVLIKQYHAGLYAPPETELVEKSMKTIDEEMMDLASEYKKQMQSGVFEGEHGDAYVRKSAEELFEREFVENNSKGDLVQLREAYEEHGDNLYLGDMEAQSTHGSYVGTPVYDPQN